MRSKRESNKNSRSWGANQLASLFVIFTLIPCPILGAQELSNTKPVSQKKKATKSEPQEEVYFLNSRSAQKLFGKPITYSESVTTDIPIPVFINFRMIGTELVKLTSGTPIEVEQMYTEMLLLDLERFLETSAYEELRAKLSGRATVTRTELSELGIVPTYNLQTGSIGLVMPNEWLRPFVLNLNSTDPGSLNPNLFAAPFSGYINIRASERVLSEPDRVDRRDSLGLVTDGVVSALGASLISGGNYFDNEFKRTETAIVVPWENGQHQLWIGDAKYSNASTVRNPQLSGVNYFKRAGRSDDHGQIDGGIVSVKNNSTLTIYKNESLLRTIQIGPGAFQLSDLALDLGQNVIRIVVKDDVTGEITERVINDFLPLYSVPLKQWEHILSFGPHRYTQEREITYSSNNVLFGGFMYGFTRQINAGVSLYQTQDFIRASQEGRYFTPIGDVSMALNESSSTTSNGASIKVQYIKSQMPGKIVRHVTVGQEVASKGYQLNEFSPGDQSYLQSKVNLSFQPVKKFSFNVGATYTDAANRSENIIFANVGRSFKINRHWRLLLSGGQNWSNIPGNDESRFMINLTYSDHLADGDFTASARQDQDISMLSARYRNDDRLNINAQVVKPVGENTDDYQSVTATKRFQRLDLGASYTGNDQSKEAYVELATALAFTNNSIAFSHPLSSSFVIFESLNPREAAFDVSNGQGKSIASGGGWFRGAVVPIPDFSQSTLSSGFSNSDYFTLESSRDTVYKSWYRSGNSVFLHSNLRATVSGQLVDEKGEKLATTSVKIVCTKDTDTLANGTFTNERGEFQFQVKRNAECYLETDDKRSDLLDLSWPVTYKDLGPIVIQ